MMLVIQRLAYTICLLSTTILEKSIISTYATQGISKEYHESIELDAISLLRVTRKQEYRKLDNVLAEVVLRSTLKRNNIFATSNEPSEQQAIEGNYIAENHHDKTSEDANEEDEEENEIFLVDVVGDSDTTKEISLSEYLRSIGFEIYSCYKNICSGIITIKQIIIASSSDIVKMIYIADPSSNIGSVTTEGDIAMMSDIARQIFDVDGKGQKVCVLSTSYNCLGGAANDINTLDLPHPDDIDIIQDLNTTQCMQLNGNDEGRAMMQIIHDVAPGAELGFRTALLGAADFANGILELADACCTVIVDDIVYRNQPFFQDGIIAQAVDEVATARGIPYFTSAGNSGRASWETTNGFVSAGFELMYPDPSTGQVFNLGTPHLFSNGNILQKITFPTASASYAISLQWDEPFGSLSTNGNNNNITASSRSDVDLYLGIGNVIRFVANQVNVGGDPIEFRNVMPSLAPELSGATGPVELDLLITLVSGPPPGLMKLIVFNPDVEFEIVTESAGTIIGQANSVNAIAVGAATFIDTIPFGVDPPRISDISSEGGIPILFDVNGNRLNIAEEDRRQPRVVGPDGGINTFFGIELNGEFRFLGTSAAAPHVAAVAALMLEVNECLNSTEVSDILEMTAIDMDDPFTENVFDVGFDDKTGYGFVNATAAVEASEAVAEKNKKSSKKCNRGKGSCKTSRSMKTAKSQKSGKGSVTSSTSTSSSKSKKSINVRGRRRVIGKNRRNRFM